MRTALVTGIAGQDGTILARRLLGEGCDVHGLVLEDPAPDWPPELREATTLHLVDLADTDAVARVIGLTEPSEIFNLAGQSSVAASWEDPLGTTRATGLGALGIFESAYRLAQAGADVRVVQASSAEIFGSSTQAPQREDTPLAPSSPYGAAKALAHVFAGIYRARGLLVSSCVLYNHESPLRPDRFVTRKITRGVARIAVEGVGELVLGNLDAARDWGWAEDYVDAMVRACRRDPADDYVVATGVTHTVEQFVGAAFRAAGIEDWARFVRVDPQFVRPVDPAVQVGDAAKARRLLGWSPTVGFDELVGRMVRHDIALLSGR